MENYLLHYNAVVKSGCFFSIPFPVCIVWCKAILIPFSHLLLENLSTSNRMPECHHSYHCYSYVLGYLWNKSFSARFAVEWNGAKVHRQFFAPGSTDCYLGQSNPLNARRMVEPCVLPTLCYSTENWILDESCLGLLNQFQSKRTKTHCNTLKVPFSLSPSPCLVLAIHDCQSPSPQVHILMLGFLCHLLSLEHDTFVCSASSSSIVSSVLLVALVPAGPRVSLVFAVSLVVLVL